MDKFINNHLTELKKKNFSYPKIELRALLNFCSINNEEIFLNNFDINKINQEKFKLAFKRRICHEPLSKISNKKEFWSLNFYVNNYVLDPRPESEFLIQGIKKYFLNPKARIRICDLGTGSGCLAITLAKIYKNSKIVATDFSNDAIKVAKKNARIHNVQNQIEFINCDWIQKKEKYDLIVSNPPYLSIEQYNNCTVDLKDFEPKIALIGGEDGLKCYKEILVIASSILDNNSFLFLEIGQSQTDEVASILRKNSLRIIKIIKDYQSIDRVLVIKRINFNKNEKNS